MTWTRLDDGWTDLPRFEDVTYEHRWHYLALIQWCSRTDRYDGHVRAADARRCSDVPDPAAALVALTAVGLLEVTDAGYRVVHIDGHVVPPHMRDEHRKAAQRDRQRRHRGKPTEPTPEPDTPSHVPPSAVTPVTGDVTRDTGTGRDGTGRDWGTTLDTTDDDEHTHPHQANSTPCPFCSDRGMPGGCRQCGTALDTSWPTS